MRRNYCTKTHQHHGVYDDAALGPRVRLEVAFVLAGYGRECSIAYPKPKVDR